MPNYQRKFSKIYDKYVAQIYRFIFLKVGTKEVAEDLTSQVFTKGWERISKIKNQKSKIKNIPAYLYQIARAEIANYYRAKPKFQIVSAEAVQLADPQPNLEHHHQLQADLELVRTGLGQLNEDYQNVLIWRYIDGFSNKEIARRLEKSEGAVRVMLHRALKELRDTIEIQ